MKKTILLPTLISIILLGCSNTNTETTLPISQTDPIMPIHYNGDVTHIFITDYIPTITNEMSISIDGGTSYQISNMANQEFDLTGDNTLSSIRVTLDSTDIVDIPILPKAAQVLGLETKGYTDSTITFGYKDEVVAPMQVRAYLQNMLIEPQYINGDDEHPEMTLTIPQQLSGRSYLRVYAYGFIDGNMQLFNDLLIPLQDGKPFTDASLLTRHDDQAQVLYSLMIDRFNNGNTTNDSKLNSEEVLDIVDYQGGDIAGITKKIEDGYFDNLGITTLWISPITQNPYDAWGKYVFKNGNKYDNSKLYTRFSGYHGYWPIYVTKIDDRFGTPKELKKLLSTAHAHNMNVIQDYVANHMHIASPTLQEHPDWHTDSILPDGRRNFELWDEARLTTWFDTHIPTLDLERPEVCNPMTDSALYWLEQYDFDGFRHDACKHIPECYWRLLTHKMKSRYPNRHLWMIGETYGSPELIGTYVKTGMLNAQFDFNVYFTAIHALVEGNGSMSDINRVICESLNAYGAHHTMGNISGNHDQIRFASLAGGGISFSEDGKEAGWTREVGIGDATTAYKKALLLEALNLTIPGVPCIYQGDEYGEVGGNDPDNRHMMRFDNLNEQEQTMLAKVKDLIQMRRTNMALMYGEYIPVLVNTDTLCFDRVYMGQRIRVTLTKDGDIDIQ